MNYLKRLEYLKNKLKKANITYQTKPIEDIENALKRLEVIDNSVKPDMEYYEKRSQALEIIKGTFNIKILGDFLIAQRGDTCVMENLKSRQSQEIINLLKEVLL